MLPRTVAWRGVTLLHRILELVAQEELAAANEASMRRLMVDLMNQHQARLGTASARTSASTRQLRKRAKHSHKNAHGYAYAPVSGYQGSRLAYAPQSAALTATPLL